MYSGVRSGGRANCVEEWWVLVVDVGMGWERLRRSDKTSVLVSVSDDLVESAVCILYCMRGSR